MTYTKDIEKALRSIIKPKYVKDMNMSRAEKNKFIFKSLFGNFSAVRAYYSSKFKRALVKESAVGNRKAFTSYIEKKGFWGGPYKVLVLEELIGLFFTLDFHLDTDQLNLIFLNKPILKKTNQNDERIILSKTETELELYWGDLQNGKPHGKGVSEKYETNEAYKKVSKTVTPTWWKKY